MATNYDPRRALGARPMLPVQWLMILIPVCINMVDGYDILALAMAAPVLADEWALGPDALGELLSFSLAGMAIGALGVSPVADTKGRRPAILFCLVLMSAGMFGAALSHGYWGMAVSRFVTGIGIGGMTSTAGAIAMEYASDKRREFAPSAVASAYPVGTIIGGFVAIAVLDEFGWRGIFWVGGMLSAILLPVAWLWLPESLDFLLTRQPRGALAKTNRVLKRLRLPPLEVLPPVAASAHDGAASIREISTPEHRGQLLLLCIAHPLNMFSFYFIINWATKWVTELGLSTAAGISYSIYVSVGGIAGGLVAGWIAGRVGVKRLTVVTLCGMAAMIILFGLLPPVLPLLVGNALLLGAMLFGSACGCWLTIAYAFPPQLRATGLGIASTVGRVGSIFGPLTAGYLLAAGLGKPLICVLLAIPAVLAAIIFSTARRYPSASA
ncbi:MFS transporter [Sphingobium lignivorans]|uniref:Benzoate transport n=1 Tax=Sphingobium lignivorans TaxID=2735886 RepID=A0ABR6NEB2_9SPHN|nr:MFS transporter [Sphingobium lignivorans]MBB5984997.1 benzoate transport [Sphingobium lignivorans]